ncbi:hypothetical protein RND81_12G149500 [Saponaria officinalis]|uniref:Protein kinase domain-containing protein n=2 Tax=Saponaria officinalis TaxID=3572 RepID=A0AAW1HAU4_SAPOF
MDAMNVAGIRFSFNALSIMTDDFSDNNIIAKTDQFNLFRAKIAAQFEDSEKEQVTVKIWHSSDKLARFREEIAILGDQKVIDCPNIAKLMGYCCEGEDVGTVYKLHSVDTLENLLDKDEFQWRHRMVAALGISRIFRFMDLQRCGRWIHATLPLVIILDQGSNPVLCDVQVLSGGIMSPIEANEAIGKDTPILGEDATAGKMKLNGIFSLGLLLFRLIRRIHHTIEDAKIKSPCAGFPIVPTFKSGPSYFQLKGDSFFYLYDYHSVCGLAEQCVDYDEKCLTISQVVQKLENLLLFSLPVRTSSGKVAVRARSLVYFTYSDLCEFTEKFSVENLFEITQFGEAYRGRIQQGWKEVGAQDIIVKMYGEVNYIRSGCRRSSTEDDICRLRDEVFLLTQRWMIDNPNVVNLLGYCFEDKKVGAVYSVQPMYTLESLFDDEWFDWKDRIVAALELARTIALFHGEEPQCVVRNICAAHIMIGQDKKPVIYDFSMLHGQLLSGQREVTSLRQNATIPNCDPYLLQSGLVVPQSDIFAFGVLLMSLICKKDMVSVIRNFIFKHFEDRYKSESSLVHESFASHPSFDHNDGLKLTAMAFACLGLDHLLSRPSASDIVEQLQSLSLFSDISTDVTAKVIDSYYTNNERKSSWWKFRRVLRKLSDKRKEQRERKFSGKDGQSRLVSSDDRAGEEIVEWPRVFRPIIFERTPEELRSRIELIDASLKSEIEENEKLGKIYRDRVKRAQSNYVKSIAV